MDWRISFADGCDAGIRIGESLAEHMMAVPITPVLEMAVVATPNYFDRFGEPATPADLARHNCLRYRLASGAVFQWEFTSPAPESHAFTVEPRGSITTNDDDGMIRAALQGVGLMQHIDVVVQRHIAEGSLVRVLRPMVPTFPGVLYLCSRPRANARAATGAYRFSGRKTKCDAGLERQVLGGMLFENDIKVRADYR